MTRGTADDLRTHLMDALPTLMSDAGRAARVRAQCRAKLERDRRRSRRLAAISLVGRHLVAPALAAGLFALYATDLVSITLRTFNA
jgi:hypothetical protein